MKLFLFLLLSLSQSSFASNKAYKDCLDWLKLIDQKRYEQSWLEADSIFQNTMKKKSWLKVIKKTMSPFGRNISRKIVKESKHEILPGTRPGKYIIYQFKSKFRKKRRVTETVTLKRGQYNIWRLVGYYIK